ncbi:PASTA domain-containing protein [Herbiconiux sp.]|uniref:protein kinase domain-containing protein n=1 Tax=Herbiconiux sp. TaxID=1871186 RepID=UPI0025B85EBC|nr:PASTA domain-containing protein [Herbiconiux sp.]
MTDIGLISGRYRLVELLGTGGSASVFRALDTETGGAVALKILHPHLSRSDAARTAFFREARAAEPLRHPNIVRVLGMGVHETGGDPQAWIALEHAAGTTLAEEVERDGPLTLTDALALADGVLSALDHAHAAGLAHRDVSPSNIIIARDRRGALRPSGVRLVDFGLADAAGRPAVGRDLLRTPDPVAAIAPDSAPEAALTPATEPPPDAAPGVLGNVNYLSPEQARGDPVDGRGDLYQLGAVLHLALVGTPPFVRADARSTMLAHLQAPPPVISVVRPGTPRAVDRLVVRALLKDPTTRFQSAAEMQVAVRAARQHLPGTRPPEHAESGAGPSTPMSADEATTPAIATASATASATSAATAATTATAILPGLPSDATRTATLTSFDRDPHPHPRPTHRAQTPTPHRPGTPRATTPARPMPPIGTRSGSLPPVTSQKATDPPPPTSTAASRPAFVLGLVALLLVAVVVVAWSLAAVGGAPAPLAAGAQPDTTAEASGPPSTLPSASAPAAPTTAPVAAATIPVPALADGTLADARAALASLGLTLGTVTAERAPRQLDTVLRVAPAIGTPVAPGTAVDVVVASGSNLVPRALGTHQVEALSSIRAAGFDVTTSTREDDAPPGTVLATVPAEGTEAQVGTTVTVVLAVPRAAGQPTATPTPAPTQAPPVPTPTSTTPPNGG